MHGGRAAQGGGRRARAVPPRVWKGDRPQPLRIAHARGDGREPVGGGHRRGAPSPRGSNVMAHGGARDIQARRRRRDDGFRLPGNVTHQSVNLGSHHGTRPRGHPPVPVGRNTKRRRLRR